eukprot:comp22050_c0_seq1/m.50919 comp22050_c0_seq1/g.50919  ORF comp22050_c0_seq1/g.50919 comp22050_c0_seq1/m.50919 type:complete len:698 (+) comp22050_c0_seq1:1-2094(+)
MIGEIDYFIDLLTNTMRIQDKPLCVDDQHELSLVYVSNTSAFHLDTDATIFQSMVDAHDHIMPLRRPRNMFTGTSPSVFHMNGYDKSQMGHVLTAMNWFHTDWEAFKFFDILAKHQQYTKKRDVKIPRCYETSIDFARKNYPWGTSSHSYTFMGTWSNYTHTTASADRDAGATPQVDSPFDTYNDTSLALYSVDGSQELDIFPNPIDRRVFDNAAWLRRRDHLVGQLRSTPHTQEQIIPIIQQLYDHTEKHRPARWTNIAEYRALCPDDLLRETEEWKYIASCNIFDPRCFDRTICPSSPSDPNSGNTTHRDFKIYVYPYNPEELSPPYLNILRELEKSPYITTDPSEACIFVPNVDVYCTLERCMLTGTWLERPPTLTERSREITRRLREMPYWEQGRNHIIFQHHEAPCTPFEIDHAMLVKTDISDYHYRWGFDIANAYVPLRQRENEQEGYSLNNSISANILGDKRDILVGFKGARTNPAQLDRADLTQLSKSKDVVILTLCRVFGYIDEGCRRDETEYVKWQYDDLLRRAKFGLVPMGYGYGSYRLLEVMSWGGVPVIAVDSGRLPLDEMLDWDKFSVRIEQKRLTERLPSGESYLEHHLRSISDTMYISLLTTGQMLYRRFLATQSQTAHAAVEMIKSRVTGGVMSDLVGVDLKLRDGETFASNIELAQFFLNSDLYWPNLLSRENSSQALP